MATVLVLTADLLFGSRVQASLSSAGHDVLMVGDESTLRARLADSGTPSAAVLVADLTDERLDGAGIVESLSRAELLGETRTLGFYSHVDASARERAQRAAFDLVIPRSRMAREGAALLDGLVDGGPTRDAR